MSDTALSLVSIWYYTCETWYLFTGFSSVEPLLSIGRLPPTFHPTRYIQSRRTGPVYRGTRSQKGVSPTLETPIRSRQAAQADGPCSTARRVHHADHDSASKIDCVDNRPAERLNGVIDSTHRICTGEVELCTGECCDAACQIYLMGSSASYLTVANELMSPLNMPVY